MPKLLLAVENATIRRVLELTFAGHGIDIVAVDDGEQAIARIPAERPDVVLADIALPQRSGYDLAAFVKHDAALAHIRVLLMAGAFETVDDAKAAEVKADGVLAKPFEPERVLVRVQQMLGLQPAAVATAAVPGAGERLVPPRPLEFPRRGEASRDGAVDTFGANPTTSRAGDPRPGLDDDDDRPLPTVERLIGGDGGPLGRVPVARADAAHGTFDLSSAGDPPATPRARPTPAQSRPTPPGDQPHKPGTIADAFAALLAFEEGDRSVPPVRLTPQPAPSAMSEDAIEEITVRVLARLAPGAIRDAVADVVSEVAERLVREEIARIRGRSS